MVAVIVSKHLKKISFYSPSDGDALIHSGVLRQHNPPTVAMSVSSKLVDEASGLYEVLLSLKVVNSQNMTDAQGKECNIVIYESEIFYSGVFRFEQSMMGNDEKVKEKRDLELNTVCPLIIFPYVDSMLMSVLTASGFTPLKFEGVNFKEIYDNHVKKSKAAAAKK